MIVAVEAQQFPVAAIRRVVVMIVIPVVHGQFTQFFAFEFAGTTAADVWQEFQCLFPVPGLSPLFFSAHPGDDAVTAGVVFV
jgi:hypothetical protein